MHKTFKRSFESLDSIFEFTEAFFSAEAIDRSLLFAVNLAVEELFTNMVKYNAGNPNEILLSLDRVDDGVVVNLTEYDVEPFDVTQTPPADTRSPLPERRVGGLGLHLVRKMVDSIDYEYADRNSKITFTKTLG